MNAHDFPLTAKGRLVCDRNGRFLFTAADAGAATDLVERLNRDEGMQHLLPPQTPPPAAGQGRVLVAATAVCG